MPTEISVMLSFLKLSFLMAIFLATASHADVGRKRLSLRFSGPANYSNALMTKYYRESPQLIDLWKTKVPEEPRKHNFERWNYEMPIFTKANSNCSGNIPAKWEVNGGAPKWGFAEWKFACGYRNPPEYVEKYYDGVLPWRRRRAEPQLRYRRYPQVIRFQERYNH